MTRFQEFSLFVRDLSGSEIRDPLFSKATNFKTSSRYPAGMFGNGSFFLPGVLSKRATQLQVGYEVRALDRGFFAYHGYVKTLEEITQDGRAGTVVTCAGPWDHILEQRGRERHWANDDLNIWKKQNEINGAELATEDRRQRLRITPKSESWLTNEVFRLVYDVPTGESFGRLESNYDFVEGGNNWTFRMLQDADTFWSLSSSSTGTQNLNTSGAPASLNLDLIAAANQTGVADGTEYAELSAVMVYAGRDSASATVGNVDIYEIGLDIIDLLGSDTSLISTDEDGLDSSLTLALAPFITNGWEMYASQLSRAAGFGDASQNAIGYGLTAPNLASDDKAKLFTETYPSLTATPEYELSMSEGNVSVRVNLDNVYNYVVVDYDDVEDWRTRLTPGTQPTLTDAASVAQYGAREKFINIGRGTAGTALNYGQRFLARHKQPTYAVTQPVRLSRIMHTQGKWIPARHIRAGERVRIVDLPSSISQNSPIGTTFLIMKTDYDHDSGMASLSLGGAPDSLAIYLSQIQKGLVLSQSLPTFV